MGQELQKPEGKRKCFSRVMGKKKREQNKNRGGKRKFLWDFEKSSYSRTQVRRGDGGEGLSGTSRGGKGYSGKEG